MANHSNCWPSNNRPLLSALLLAAFALAGCGKSTPQSPPKQMVEDTLRAGLPAFLSLDAIELEPISTGPETVKVNFKATVAPKEDLCQVDREVDGTPKVTLLKVVQVTGTKTSLYGSIEAHRTVDKWTLESPQIQTGFEQFGKPRGAFDAHSYVTGTDEANAALRQQSVNAELQERARKAALEQQERERIAREEQQAREETARREREEKARVALEEQRQREVEQQRLERERREKEAAPAELVEIEEKIAKAERDLATCRRAAAQAHFDATKRQAESDAAYEEREIAKLKARKAKLTALLGR